MMSIHQWTSRLKLTIIIGLFLGWCCSLCAAQSGGATNTTTQGASEATTLRDMRFRARESAAQPWLGAFVQDAKNGANTAPGARVESVVENSPAAQAGLLKGDVITQIAGQRVANAQELARIVSTLTIGNDYPIRGWRDGVAKQWTFRPTPRPTSRFETAVSTSVDDVSGTPAPRTGLLDINVLKYALIDANTRTVTFVGNYDPNYGTGPIPYEEYLRVALRHPYPSLSLDPSRDTLTSLKKAQQIIDADMVRMENPDYGARWAQRVANLLIYEASLQADRNRLFQNCASALQMSRDDFTRMYDAATGKHDIPATEFMGLAAKMVRGIGLTKAGDALGVLAAGGTPEELLSEMAEKLGLSDQYKALAMRGLPPEEFRKEAIILCISELCRHFDAPENEIQRKITAIRSGESANLIIDYMGKKLNEYISNKSGRRMINGLVLGPEVIAKLYDLPLPKADVVFTDLPSDSLLGEVFFQSDYRLKSVCTFPDVKTKVPAHLTQQEFMQHYATTAMNQKLCRVNLRAGNRLVPGEVKMRVSPTGDLVAFGASKIQVVGWIIDLQGQVDKETTAFISTALTKYADFLTEHYDAYARVYPEWHKLTEAAKIIAFARWATQNGYTLNVTGEPKAMVKLPAQVNGFWSAVFEVGEDSQYLNFIAEGGASFAKDEGERWLQLQQDATITADVSKQLAASAIFAEQAVGAALSNDLESARALAEKSAQAMTGEIDLSRLPGLDALPIPSNPAAYGAATRAAIGEASACLDTLNSAANDIERAQQLMATSPDDANILRQQALRTRDEAQARLKRILDQVAHYRSDPSRADEALVALHNTSAVVKPVGSSTSSSSGATVGQDSTDAGWSTPTTKPEDWYVLVHELDEVNKQIAVTREALLKLNATILANRQLFEEWENSASEAFDRCVSMIGDIALDFGISGLVERRAELYKLARKLPGKPDDVIEKYRYAASLTQRLKEAKAVNDVAGLAAREHTTEAELWETLRDGVNQLSGLLSLDESIPGKWWKYGILSVDTAYNLTELHLTWKNLTTLEANTQQYALAVQQLSDRLKALVDRQQQLRKKIEAGKSLEFGRTETK